MSGHRLVPILALLRQGVAVGLDFGAHSLETLLRVAETIETGVYRTGSLARTPEGFSFVLDNPPLRLGAFSAVRLVLGGRAVPPDRVRIRTGGAGPWRELGEISSSVPLELLPGVPTEVEVEDVPVPDGAPLTVRLEFTSLAIPPLVWFEFTEHMRPEGRE